MKNKIKNTFLSLSLLTLLGTTSIFSTSLVRKTATGTAFYLASRLSSRQINRSGPLYHLAGRNLYVSEFKVTTDSGGNSTSIYNNGNMQAVLKLTLNAHNDDGTTHILSPEEINSAKIVPAYTNVPYDESMPNRWGYSHSDNDYAHHIPGSGKKIMASDELPIISHQELMKGIQVVGTEKQQTPRQVNRPISLYVTCDDKLETQEFAAAIKLTNEKGEKVEYTTRTDKPDLGTFTSSVFIRAERAPGLIKETIRTAPENYEVRTVSLGSENFHLNGWDWTTDIYSILIGRKDGIWLDLNQDLPDDEYNIVWHSPFGDYTFYSLPISQYSSNDNNNKKHFRNHNAGIIPTIKLRYDNGNVYDPMSVARTHTDSHGQEQYSEIGGLLTITHLKEAGLLSYWVAGDGYMMLDCMDGNGTRQVLRIVPYTTSEIDKYTEKAGSTWLIN